MQLESPVADGSTRHIDLRRLPDGEPIELAFEPPAAALNPRLVEFTPDGRQLALVAQDGSTSVLDAATGRLVERGTTEPNPASASWSADGTRLVTGSFGGALRVWDVTDGLEQVLSIPLARGSTIRDIDPAENDEHVVVTMEDSEVKIVDLTDGRTVGRAFQWGGAQLQAAAVSPDGRFVAALSRDGTVRIWDTERGGVLGPALRAVDRGDQGELQFSDPRTFVVLSATGTGQRWRVDLERWIDLACRLAARPLSEDEWRQYIPGTAYAPSCG
jgi:WD40 repeat protein